MTAPTVTSTPHLGTVETNGTISKIPSVMNQNANSGVLDFDGFTINVDPTKYNIGAGTGYISNPETGIATKVTWAAQTAQTTPYLATSVATYVLKDSAGATVLQNSYPTTTQFRTHIYLGKLAHTTFTTILFVVNEPSRMYHVSGDLHDLVSTFGSMNRSGNMISPNGANLQINVSAGETYREGANFSTNRNSPNITNEPAVNATSFRNKFRNGSGGWSAVNTTTVDPNYYDNGTGILALVPNNKFTLKVVYRFGGTGTIHMDYGQAVYDNMTAADNGISATVASDPDTKNFASRIGWIIIQQGATSLLDVTKYKFVPADKIGERAATASGVTSLQGAYNNSVTPQITTTPTGGALSIKQGSGSDTDAVLAVQNGSGTGTFSVTGAGNIKANNIIDKRTIAEIRAFTGTLQNTQFYTTDIGKEGNWYYDASDTTTADNTGTVLVTADGKRIKRVISGNINAKWFGAVGDGVSDDTAEIQNAINVTGGLSKTLFFPAGNYVTSGNIEINSKLNILGEGEALNVASDPLPTTFNRGRTAISCSSNSNNLFVVNVDGISFEKITLYSTAATPTGSGIVFNKGNVMRMSNVGVYNFYINLDIINGGLWNVFNCDFYNPVSSNLRVNFQLIPDGGDQSITNCNFYTGVRTGITHLLYRGGGGLKITGCKFNQGGSTGSYAKDCIKMTNDVGNTVDLLISNSSFENYTDSGIDLSPSFDFQFVVINGNQFWGNPSTATNGILLNSSNLYNVNISGNVIDAVTNGINYASGNRISVNGNAFGTGVTNKYVNTSNFLDSNHPARLIVGKGDAVSNFNAYSSNSKTVNSSNVVGSFLSNDAAQQGVFVSLKGGASTTDRYGEISSYENGFGVLDLRLQNLGGKTIIGGALDILGTPTAPTATAGTNTTQIATTAFVQGVARPYKVYTALLSQTGTNAPTATVLENTLGGTVVWTRNTTGDYRGTLTGVFTNNKTLPIVNLNSGLENYSAQILRLDVDTIQLTTGINSSASDGVLNSWSNVEIRVYN